MKRCRFLVPFLGILALILLFLKLPEVPNVFLLKCKTCSSNDPYLELIGAAYFALLVGFSVLFPTFPSPQIARAGLIWSGLLALILTYLKWPQWCIACLIAHLCNIMIWLIWSIFPAINRSKNLYLKERWCFLWLAPLSVVAVFSCLNLTFMAYGFKNHSFVMHLQPGEDVPSFTLKTMDGKLITHIKGENSESIVINFISPDCPYCKEQLPYFNCVSTQLAAGSYRFINISPGLPPELIQYSPDTEWVEDIEGSIRKLFKVSGFPTLFVIGTDGKIAHVISGVPEELETSLLAHLTK